MENVWPRWITNVSWTDKSIISFVSWVKHAAVISKYFGPSQSQNSKSWHIENLEFQKNILFIFSVNMYASQPASGLKIESRVSPGVAEQRTETRIVPYRRPLSRNKHHSSESVWPNWAIYWTLGNFLKPLTTIYLSKSPTFLGDFL